MMARRVGGLRKHPHGRVDQLEDRYLGMVEAPSSNLGTSTPLHFIDIHGLDRAATTVLSHIASVVGPHVHHSIDSFRLLSSATTAHGPVRTVWCSQTVGGSVANFAAATALR